MLGDILNPAYNTSAVLFAGYLTDNGSNIQFQAFTEKWIHPIASLMPTKPHGGEQYAICQYKPSTKTLDIIFKDRTGRIYSWKNMLHNEFEEL